MQADYYENLQGIADEVHPFLLNNNSINDAEKLNSSLNYECKPYERMAEEQDINDHKGVMKKFRNQITAISRFHQFLVALGTRNLTKFRT